MELKPVLIEWEDMFLSRALLSKEEAKEKLTTETIQTIGFLVLEKEDSIVVSQTHNLTKERFLNNTDILRNTIINIKQLKPSKKESEIALIEWATENNSDYEAYNKGDLENLDVSSIQSMGFLSKDEENCILSFEKMLKSDSYRNKLFIHNNQIKKTKFYTL